MTNNMRLKDFQELEELFVDMEELLRDAAEGKEYTENHYLIHCDHLKQINQKYQKIKKGAIGKYCKESRKRRTPNRTNTITDEDEKREAYEKGESGFVKCKDCCRLVKKYNLTVHRHSKLCKTKRNLKVSGMVCKNLHSEFHYEFQNLGDKMEHYIYSHSKTVRENEDRVIESVLNWKVNDDGKYELVTDPYDKIEINKEIKLDIDDFDLYTRQYNQLLKFIANNNGKYRSISNSKPDGTLLSVKFLEIYPQ